ncbi:MAG TPA: cation:proton antiporter [Stellaceae bacterium]|jgi:CPA1 family monovalent cation:H+ antiporter|nr:cation:proton antiporter [Stellaceae bacterium]
MDLILSHTVALLVTAIVVAMLARRVRLPYTVGLVITGIGLALTHVQNEPVLTHDFIFDVILPPLLFEAALALHWSELRRDALPLLTLAVLGVLIAAAAVACGMVFALGWPVAPALVFGTLIAATDPVAVIALFKDTQITGRMRLLVEGESLLNDGVAAVFFAFVLTWAQMPEAAPIAPGSVLGSLTWTAGGGTMIGLACGGLAILVAGGTADHLVETALTTVAAYGSFLLAEYLHASGVLAAVAAGLLMGNVGVLRERILSQRGREFVIAFWEFAAFIANSLIFLLIGLTVAGIRFEGLGWPALMATIMLVLLSRALSVYPLCLCFAGSRWAVPAAEQHVLWWGGLRGALGLALALSLPPSLPLRNQIVIATFGVVVFSVTVQGVTMPVLLALLRRNRRDGA